MSRRKTRPTAAVRIDADLAEKLAIVCRARRRCSADVLSPMIRSELERLYSEAVEELAARKSLVNERPVINGKG